MYDPVCGMDILPEHAAATALYDGQRYYFCAPICHERFLAHPELYRDTLQPTTCYARQLYAALTTLQTVFYQSATPAEDTLSEAERQAITAIGRCGESPMKRLAVICQVALSTMTGIIDRLIERGLVQRRHSPTDRRLVLVQLTPGGQRLYQQRLDADMRLVLTMLQALEVDEQHTLIAFLQKILTSLPGESLLSPGDLRSVSHGNTTS